MFFTSFIPSDYLQGTNSLSALFIEGFITCFTDIERFPKDSKKIQRFPKITKEHFLERVPKMSTVTNLLSSVQNFFKNVLTDFAMYHFRDDFSIF